MKSVQALYRELEKEGRREKKIEEGRKLKEKTEKNRRKGNTYERERISCKKRARFT